MNCEDVVSRLAEHENELCQMGVASLALFGSVARNDANDLSDVDCLVEFDRPTGLFGLIRLEQHLERLLNCKVDLGTPDSLKPPIRARVLAESLRVL